MMQKDVFWLVVMALAVLNLSRCTSGFTSGPLLISNEWNRRPQKNIPLPGRVLSSSRLFSSSHNSKKNLSASEQERRSEETRRQKRKSDVVIGKTSAVQDAKDYAIDTKSTEEAWMKQASQVEQEVFRQTEQGIEMLKTLRLEEASEAFDRVFELRPNAYLWQAGIVRFYQRDLEGAAEVFARNAAAYESRFGEPASEERIWRDACQLKVYYSMDRKERKAINEADSLSGLVAQIPERDEMAQILSSENRKVLRIIRELFAASIEKDAGKEVLARAKLRAICGTTNEQAQVDRKMWKLNAWYYLGLHYDVLGDEEESKKCMKMALRLCPNGNGDDIIHTLPILHMARRDWFDDDEFEEDPDDSEDTHNIDSDAGNRNLHSANALDRGTKSDPVVVESIRRSVSNMKYTQLADALKTRGLKPHGPKEALAGKLFNSLLEDAGLD